MDTDGGILYLGSQQTNLHRQSEPMSQSHTKVILFFFPRHALTCRDLHSTHYALREDSW